MRKTAIAIALSFLVTAAVAQDAGPALPVLLGAQLETGWGDMPPSDPGTGIVRATPFIGWWVRGLGFVRGGYAAVTHTVKDTLGTTERRERAISAQAGASFAGPEAPYLLGSYTRGSLLTSDGDASWNEWGLGLGTLVPIGAWAALVCEVEYRWIGEHLVADGSHEESGTRMQMNVGFSIYVH